MKIDLQELGKRIKLTRRGQDLTQEMLAEKAGVSQHYIYEIEAGRKAMSIHSFASLTTASDVSADYLLFGDGQRIFDVDTPAHHNNQLMEIAAELLLEAKGFSNAVVSVTDGNVDVVINSTKLDDTLRAQVEDIVKRKTGVSADKITINIRNN